MPNLGDFLTSGNEFEDASAWNDARFVAPKIAFFNNAEAGAGFLSANKAGIWWDTAEFSASAIIVWYLYFFKRNVSIRFSISSSWVFISASALLPSNSGYNLL